MDAVILDIDGTLIESMSVDTELYFASVAEILGPVTTRDRLDDYEHVTDSWILKQLLADNGLPDDERTIESVYDTFVARLSEHIESKGPFEAIDGAKRFVRRLRSSDHHLVAIATGGWGRSARIKLDSAGIDVSGIPLASSDDADAREAIMTTALAKLSRDVQSVTYFGDAEWDRRACRALGWDFVAVGPGLDGLRSFDGIEL